MREHRLAGLVAEKKKSHHWMQLSHKTAVCTCLQTMDILERDWHTEACKKHTEAYSKAHHVCDPVSLNYRLIHRPKYNNIYNLVTMKFLHELLEKNSPSVRQKCAFTIHPHVHSTGINVWGHSIETPQRQSGGNIVRSLAKTRALQRSKLQHMGQE